MRASTNFFFTKCSERVVCWRLSKRRCKNTALILVISNAPASQETCVRKYDHAQKRSSRLMQKNKKVNRYRGATIAARAPKPDKTPITQRPPRSILQNSGKTAVLPVLPPMALEQVLRFRRTTSVENPSSEIVVRCHRFHRPYGSFAT